jgi:hypothetical protein
MPQGTLSAILKQAGISAEDFINMKHETFIEFLRKWYEVVIPVQTGIQYL